MLNTGDLARALSSRAKAVRDAGAGALNWAVSQLGRTLDRRAWAAATSWREYLAAVSWPRVGVVAGVAVVPVVAGWVVFVSTRPVAYPPPMPSEASIELYAKAVKDRRPTPPPGLVEANRTWTGES